MHRKKTALPTNEHLQELVPREALQFCQWSYMGGWFERTIVGHIPGITYEYDLISAYPWAMTQLPCLEHAKWVKNNERVMFNALGNIWTVGEFHVKGSNKFLGAMNQRNKDGTICRPSETTGYYWGHEIDAARDAGLIDLVSVGDCWTLIEGCNCGSPLKQLLELFQERKRLSKTSIRGKALKLVLNSMYGKLAQSVGSPKYANPVYASLITSLTRTRILDAISRHPKGAESVAMIATDGIYFTSEHTNLKLGEELGDWEQDMKENLTIFKPGSYWDDKGRKSVNKIKSRGIPSAALYANIPELDTQFRLFSDKDVEFNDANADPHGGYPTIDIHVPFTIVSPRLALARGKWDTCGLVSSTIRTESSRPEPKRSDLEWDNDGKFWRVGVRQDGSISYPYEKTFGIDPDEELFTYDGSYKVEITDLVATMNGSIE